MPKKEIETYCPKNRTDWRKWLEKNHQSKQAVWLVYFKSSTKISRRLNPERDDQAGGINLRNLRWGMKIVRNKKLELDELLSAYNIRYTIEVIVNKDLHGNQDIATRLNFHRK